MKIFLDTNVILEYLEARGNYQHVKQIFNDIEDGKLDAYISTGSIYTLTYLILSALKRKHIYRPEQVDESRKILNNIIHLIHVIDLSHVSISSAINDIQFTDLEDSYQYHCALEHKCDYFITLNTKDFRHADTKSMTILSPEQFIDQIV